MRVTIRFVPGLKVTIDLVESLAVGPYPVMWRGWEMSCVVPGRNIRDLDQSELEYKEASLYFNLFSSTNFYLLTTHREKESPRNNRI